MKVCQPFDISPSACLDEGALAKLAHSCDVRIHDLRHTFASLLVSCGGLLEMIGRWLVHTQIGTTQHYSDPIASSLKGKGSMRYARRDDTS